jgi:carbon-monoxide dehydrogenase medium subunit
MAENGNGVSYFAPENFDEALDLLQEHSGELSVLSGGTDLVRDMNLEFKVPQGFLWIGKLGLEYVKREGGYLHIGAATRMETAGHSDVLLGSATAVARAAGKLASPPVRSLATLGGNLCTASPAADTACALLGLDAEVVLAKKGGERTIPLKEFFTGPGQTVLEPAEILKEILVRPTEAGEGSAYAKVGRRQAMTLAVLNAACRVKLADDDTCEQVVIAVGAAAPTPMRALNAEEVLRGKPFTEEAIEQAAQAAAEEVQPIDDVHGTAWYRRKLAKVLVARTLQEAGEQARETR